MTLTLTRALMLTLTHRSRRWRDRSGDGPASSAPLRALRDSEGAFIYAEGDYITTSGAE